MLDSPLDSPLMVLEEQVRDLYNAKNQLLQALPTLAKHATSESLRRAMQGPLEEGEEVREENAEPGEIDTELIDANTKLAEILRGEVLPVSETAAQQPATSPDKRSSR